MYKFTCIVLISLLVAGCDQYSEYDGSSSWDNERINAWKHKSKAECKPNGYALDRASGGYSRISEILICPDGTLAILPIK